MTTLRQWLLSVLLALASLLVTACGGSDEYWDEFRPRPAVASDLAGQTFVFRDFSYGAVFDSSLSTTTTTLALGAATPVGAQIHLPFSLTAGSSSAAGTATLTAQTLTLDFAQAGTTPPFRAGTPLVLGVLADVDDGRIQLRNEATGVSQTSAPR